jgi:hypothetical protein
MPKQPKADPKGTEDVPCLLHERPASSPSWRVDNASVDCHGYVREATKRSKLEQVMRLATAGLMPLGRTAPDTGCKVWH